MAIKLNYTTTRDTTKAWITPDLKFVPLKVWHWEWLMANKDMIAKKYKVNLDKLKAKNEQTVRLEGLRNGFTRINYTQNGGVFTAEANEKYWTSGLKSLLRQIILDNIQMIDAISIAVISDDAEVVDDEFVRLTMFPSKERKNNLPKILESTRQGEAESIVNKLLDSNVGEAFTITPPPGYEDSNVFSITLKDNVRVGTGGRDTTGARATVKFKIDEEWRSWGLKGLTPTVLSIELEYTTEDENGENEESHSLSITPDNFQISTESEDRIPMTATQVEVEVDKKSAIVYF